MTMLSWVALITGIGGYAWVLAYSRHLRGEPLLAGDHLPSPIGFVDIIASFICWLFCQFVAGAVLIATNGGPAALTEMTPQTISQLMLLGSLSQLVATVVIATFLLLRYQRLSVAGLRVERLAADLKIGLVGYVMIIPAVLLIQWGLSLLVPYEHPTLKLLTEKPTFATMAICWISAVLIAPLTEEFFFRGVLQNWLQRLGPNAKAFQSNEILVGGYDNHENHSRVEPPLSESESESEDLNPYRSPPQEFDHVVGQTRDDSPPMWPIFVTSTIFAMMHFGQGAAPVALFVLSLGLGFLYRQTSSIVPCFVVHFLLNGFSMFWFTISVIYGEAS